MKIKLQNKFGENSPFVAVGDAEEINKINFDITKTFQLESGINSIKSIDFNYKLHYQRSNNQSINVETKAVLFAYDNEQTFVAPFFVKFYQLNDY
ncbi:MAG: hypothetical protein ACI9DK_000222 [Vicingaceae bacterium]|jgi:hypothetical protein